ncbi:hypothetical protein [Caldimonas sp. KR1-144]|uniref:hypothetical protein n=1 Tax=Caldimonas sp. KR1-144 TaxID=3400911 RepID=UPI003C0B284E
MTPGYIARAKNGFYEVTKIASAQSAPYLWGDYVSDGVLATASFDPGRKRKVLQTYGVVIGPGSTYQPTSSFYNYVGDRYLLRIGRDSSSADGPFWPVLVRDTLGDEFPPASENRGKSISFYGLANLEGGADINEFQRIIGAFASGWDGTKYRFGYGGLWQDPDGEDIFRVGGPSNGTLAITNRVREYRAWFSNTLDFAVSTQTWASTNREICMSRIFVGGPGKLAALKATLETVESVDYVDMGTPEDSYYAGTWKPRVKVKLVTSNDHGASWNESDADFLEPYIEFKMLPGTGLGSDPWSPPGITHFDRFVMNGNQLLNMMMGARVVYVGNNTRLLMVPQCRIAPGQWGTLLFRDAGSGFSRVAWPADSGTWLAPSEFGGSADLVLSFSGYFFAHWFSWGPGCAYYPVNHDNKMKLLVTVDAGDTWTLTPELPADINHNFIGTALGTTVRPRTDTSPGRVLFPRVDEAAGRIEWLATGGDLSAFAAAGDVAAPGIEEEFIGYAGRYFVYIGDGATRRRYVNPAFPGEFDKP